MASLVAEVLSVFLEVRLKARRSLDEAREILRQSELRAFRPQDLRHRPSSCEADARHPVRIAQPDPDRRGGLALLVQADDRLLDFGFFHRHPLGVGLQVRTGRTALSLAVCMEARHHFLGRGSAYRGRIFNVEPAASRAS